VSVTNVSVLKQKRTTKKRKVNVKCNAYLKVSDGEIATNDVSVFAVLAVTNSEQLQEEKPKHVKVTNNLPEGQRW
jgi:hypothetical protein